MLPRRLPVQQCARGRGIVSDLAEVSVSALTIRQPYPWAILAGLKTVEVRSWSTGWRGLLGIHAGAGWSTEGEALVLAARDHDPSAVRWPAPAPPVGTALPREALVGAAMLTGIHQVTDDPQCCGPWGDPALLGMDGRRPVFHWELGDVRALPEPIPHPGRQGLWPTTGNAFALRALYPPISRGYDISDWMAPTAAAAPWTIAHPQPLTHGARGVWSARCGEKRRGWESVSAFANPHVFTACRACVAILQAAAASVRQADPENQT